MASYKYQQNLYDGAAEGYVRYNITPSPGTYVAPGEQVTISGQAYRRDSTVYGVVVELFVGDMWEDPAGYRSETAAQKSVKISKGKTGTFSLSFTMTSEMAQNLGRFSGRAFDAQLGFMLADDSALTGGAATTAAAAQKVSILKSRLAPVIVSAGFTDATGAADVFGGFVQGESELLMAMQTETDPLDSAVTVAKRELTLGAAVHELSSDGQNVGAVNLPGDVDWTLKVTDSRGMSAETSGVVSLLPYQPPVIEALTAQRYVEAVADDGSVSYIPSDDGERVRFSLSGAVSPVAGLNSWTLSVASGGGQPVVVREGADGTVIILTDDRDAVTGDVSASERAEFTWTLTDCFSSVTMRAVVEKSGAYFNVEKNGVAVGMRSTGMPDAKKFEVAEKYESVFYGGIRGVTDYSEEEVPTGGKWIDGKPIYRRVVKISGAAGTFVSVDIADANVDHVVSISGSAYVKATSPYYAPLDFTYFNSSNSMTTHLFTYVQNGTVKMKAGQAFDAWVVLEYTKK